MIRLKVVIILSVLLLPSIFAITPNTASAIEEDTSKTSATAIANRVLKPSVTFMKNILTNPTFHDQLVSIAIGVSLSDLIIVYGVVAPKVLMVVERANSSINVVDANVKEIYKLLLNRIHQIIPVEIRNRGQIIGIAMVLKFSQATASGKSPAEARQLALGVAIRGTITGGFEICVGKSIFSQFIAHIVSTAIQAAITTENLAAAVDTVINDNSTSHSYQSMLTSSIAKTGKDIAGITEDQSVVGVIREDLSDFLKNIGDEALLRTLEKNLPKLIDTQSKDFTDLTDISKEDLAKLAKTDAIKKCVKALDQEISTQCKELSEKFANEHLVPGSVIQDTVITSLASQGVSLSTIEKEFNKK